MADPQHPAPVAAGSLIANRFEIERLAGSGGMGSVYRALDRHSGSLVALKLLHSNTATGRSDGERFAREAQLLSELRHPGIVSHIAHGQTSDGQRFLAMEWLDGNDLGERLQLGPLSLRDCVTVTVQLADALAAAHDRGIVHRDLKPSNLFLCDNDLRRVKILDFGIARRLAPSQAMTRTGVVIGTPEYMAPEQARGNRELTAAADLFSVGCVLYECLTGVPPFVADHVAAVLVRILFEEPPAVAERRPGVPPALVGLIARLLHKDPAQRLADAASLRADLLGLGELSEPSPASAVVQVQPAEGFAEHEQSLFSIVLAAPPSTELEVPAAAIADLAQAATPPEGGALFPAEREALLQAIQALGATPESLANGSLVVTVSSTGSAQDQAVQAARAALLIKERWPGAVVSMATGRGALRGRTAVGEVVELASRSLKLGSRPSTPILGVLLDSLSAKLLEGRFTQTLEPHGTILVGEERDADASRPLLGKPTPCVGREAELGILEAQLTGCIDESYARAILITAAPGVGKSRLRHEFLRRVERRSEPVTVLTGRADLLQAGAAYAIVARAIRSICEISERQPLAQQRLCLRARLESLSLSAAELALILPFLGEVCSVPFPASEHPLLHEAQQMPKVLPERLRQACLAWLAAECRARPVLFVLDDLHWGDELSIAFLDDALRELRGAPLLVLALSRPEIYQTYSGLWKGHRPQEIELKGLSRRACERLILQALGSQVSADAVKWMIEQSAGNALFLEELIRAAAEGQLHERPETVIAMLQARIGHLAPGARRAVLAASVFGQTVWSGGVARLLDLAEYAPELDEQLRALMEAELIEPHGASQVAGECEYGFRHALVRDAAYGLLTESDQKLGHKLAAEFLESRAEQQISSAVLAYHFRQAGLTERAIHHYLLAGDAAAKVYIFEEARRNYAEAEGLIRELPSTPALARRHADTLIKWVRSSLMVSTPELNFGRLAQARQLLAEIEGVSDADGGEQEDRLRLAWLDYCEGRLHHWTNRPNLAAQCYQRVLPVAREFFAQELILVPSVFLGQLLVFRGQVRAALAMLEPTAPTMERWFGRDIETLRAYMYLAQGIGLGGRGVEAKQLIDYVRPWVEEAKQPIYSGVFCVAASAALGVLGELHEALELVQQGLVIAQQIKEPHLQYLSWDQSAVIYLMLGDHEEAMRRRTRAVELRQLYGGGMAPEIYNAFESAMHLAAGRSQLAAELAERVARTSRPAELMFALTKAERVLAWALARLGASREEVDSHFHASCSAADSTGQVMEALRTVLAWGTACMELGDRAGAESHFQELRARITDEITPRARQDLQTAMEQAMSPDPSGAGSPGQRRLMLM